MYYEGINSNKGKRINEDEAFGYAMECILKDEEEYDEFENEFGRTLILGMISCRSSFISFAKDVVDWFYSGDWIRRNGDAYE